VHQDDNLLLAVLLRQRVRDFLFVWICWWFFFKRFTILSKYINFKNTLKGKFEETVKK